MNENEGFDQHFDLVAREYARVFRRYSRASGAVYAAKRQLEKAESEEFEAMREYNLATTRFKEVVLGR